MLRNIYSTYSSGSSESEDEYNDMLSKMNTRINWSQLKDYEKGDTTSGSQTMACSGDSCEIVDIGV